MTIRVDVQSGQLPDLIEQVRAGHDVIFMENDQPVAKLVAASPEIKPVKRRHLIIPSLKGHVPRFDVVTQSELAEEMFDR